MIAAGSTDLWLLLLGAIAATYLWRGLGVVFSSRIDPNGTLFLWITCVSYAMLAGLIARMVVLPVGPLTEVPLTYRAAGIAIGVAVFFLCGRRLLIGIGAGLLGFVALVFVTSP